MKLTHSLSTRNIKKQKKKLKKKKKMNKKKKMKKDDMNAYLLVKDNQQRNAIDTNFTKQKMRQKLL